MQIGFIGVGKITNAIVEGLCTSSIQDTQIWLSPRNEANARQLAEKYTAVQRLESNQQVVDRSDIVFVAVRPAVAVEVLQELVFRKEQIVVSLVPLLKEADLLAAVAPVTGGPRCSYTGGDDPHGSCACLSCQRYGNTIVPAFRTTGTCK